MHEKFDVDDFIFRAGLLSSLRYLRNKKKNMHIDVDNYVYIYMRVYAYVCVCVRVCACTHVYVFTHIYTILMMKGDLCRRSL